MMKKNINRQNQKKHTLMDSMYLPKDIVQGNMRITLTGNQEAWIENYRGLLEYTDQCIRLQGKNEQIEITGHALCIEYYTNEDMKICGCFSGIKFI